MTKGYLTKILLSFAMLSTVVIAQENVDAIEKARQAKEAADKAAAEAAAATSAAIEAAATKAAKEARSEAKRKKEEEEARKIAEAQAAEEAELDAAASAAAEEAKRKMAAELGLEIDDPEVEEAISNDTVGGEEEADEVVAKEALGWNVGATASVGLISGSSFTSVPLGGTFVLTTPVGFDVGPFNYTLSVAFGGYQGKYESEQDSDYSLPEGGNHWIDEFNPSFFGLGGNLTLANLVFVEGHLGVVGEGSGLRGFAGVTLERLMKNSLNLPFNLLVGSEVFYSSDIAGIGNSSGWASLGLRLDYGF